MSIFNYLSEATHLFKPEDLQNLPKTSADSVFIVGVLNVVFGLVGTISVLIIAIAGFDYVRSGGDSQKTAKAKDAIMYAVIGVVVSISAIAIVNFIIRRAFPF